MVSWLERKFIFNHVTYLHHSWIWNAFKNKLNFGKNKRENVSQALWSGNMLLTGVSNSIRMPILSYKGSTDCISEEKENKDLTISDLAKYCIFLQMVVLKCKKMGNLKHVFEFFFFCVGLTEQSDPLTHVWRSACLAIPAPDIQRDGKKKWNLGKQLHQSV